MHIDVNGTRLWFDVDGPALVPDGPEMRPRPTVILLHGGPGSFDHTSPAIARELHDALPPGLARLEVIEGAGPFAWKDAPERYWPVLTDFVTRAAAAPTVRS